MREGVGEGKLGWKREGGAREGKGEEIKCDESLSGEGKRTKRVTAIYITCSVRRCTVVAM